ncbi:MAG: bifunctional phosphoribosyl-AMP cyclohydrolase/phosphoribosyl-ATP diphosphatase HisIE [Oscillospiraceae bacterium]|nr:bifunctional phosphoribosyl-AMP cyclohydrolase/phosphoribosyl-ATP diphosphatase HisIE [Oscillospiraceae bacterium]
MLNFDKIKFDNQGLIPAIVVDDETKKVLTLAYMNRESLEISVREKRTCFWSRSRQELWRKGETSGHVQQISRIVNDCDGDALAVYVKKSGPACHTGADSCFENILFENPDLSPAFSVGGLMELIADRKLNQTEGSYTTYLFQKGLDKILKKIGEESAEVLIAAKGGDKAETIFEIADLTYHIMVLMTEMGITADDVVDELASRHVVDHKVKQEKMQ